MATKRIQLRGISRTPSDRMTNDGGCAESLNVQLDNTEVAPSFYPDDETTKRGLPANLEADKIFIHKTANYENYIVQQGQKLIAYTHAGKKDVVTLFENESLTDIDAIGNIVIITTGETVYYSLWKNDAYKFIGNSLPVPSIRIDVIGNDDENFATADRDRVRLDTSGEIAGSMNVATFKKPYFEAAAKGRAESEEVNAYMQGVKNDFWAKVQQLKEKIGKWGHFSCPRLVRYAVRLYDGSYVYHSVPILVGAGSKEWLSATGHKTPTENMVVSSISFTVNLYYRAIAKLITWEVEEWTDIISGVDFFISEDIAFPRINQDFETCDDGGGNIYFKGYDNYFEEAKDEILSKTYFYKIASVAAGDLDSLKAGIDLHKDEDVEKSETLVVKERLTSDYMMSHKVVPRSAMTYNSRLLINASKIELPSPYTQLNGLYCDVKKAYTDVELDHQIQRQYKFKFFIRRNNGEEFSVIARTADGSMNYLTPFISNGMPSHQESTFYADPMAWIAYPDTDCYKVEIDLGGGDIAVVDMSAHPALSCSYAFFGLDEYLRGIDAIRNDSEISLDEKKTYSVNNQVMLSEFSNPFIFPVGNRYSQQSKVIGIALATTALSQGQFGQFPLYVFTEDGIWAMETAVDGSFVASKLLSREVCINPDSITAIDNAVVFVTAQGVMLLQGSQVVNISPYMNGRHYDIENAAKSIVEGQPSFAPLLSALTDNTHFMAYVKEASIAYDYAGQRLIFIKKGEGYQYIYKLDTQTWHKSSYGVNLIAPINSYPECLVQGKGGERTVVEWSVTENESQEEVDYLAGRIRTIIPDISDEEVAQFLFEGSVIDVSEISEDDREWLYNEMEYYHVNTTFTNSIKQVSCVYNLSTILDAQESKKPMQGVIATRPFDLDEPDVFKTITDVRIRGQFRKGAVKFILLGSNDGVTFSAISTLRGKAWKLFRIIILADLQPTERISWIDVQYETRFTNRLR